MRWLLPGELPSGLYVRYIGVVSLIRFKAELPLEGTRGASRTDVEGKNCTVYNSS